MVTMTMTVIVASLAMVALMASAMPHALTSICQPASASMTRKLPSASAKISA
jgi:hypothetical protein